jgi:hypothetical protein
VAEVEAPDDLNMLARPLAFRRAINNLVGNAASHGEKVRLSARPLPSGGLEILVEDDGPGIPDDMHEEAFRPFSRLDASRNQNRKGVGLGLAVAQPRRRHHPGPQRPGRTEGVHPAASRSPRRLDRFRAGTLALAPSGTVKSSPSCSMFQGGLESGVRICVVLLSLRRSPPPSPFPAPQQLSLRPSS